MSAPRREEKGPFHPWVYFTILGDIQEINRKMIDDYPHAEILSACLSGGDGPRDEWFAFCRTRDGSKVPDDFEDHV